MPTVLTKKLTILPGLPALLVFIYSLTDRTSRRTVVSDCTRQSDRTGLLFFRVRCTFSIRSFSSSYFLPLFHCLIFNLLFPCASVWENTRALVPHFPQHTEWNLLSSGTNTLLWWRACYKITNYTIYILFADLDRVNAHFLPLLKITKV